MYNVTLIPGDGIGPEISESVQRVLEASGATAESFTDAIIGELK